jgi:hypothetical protein
MNTKMTASLRNQLLTPILCGALLTGLAQTGRASNLVTDGTFLQYSGAGTAQINAGSGFTQLTYWQTPLNPPAAYNSYNFLFLSGTADTSPGAFDDFGNYVELYGPGNGNPNGLPATDPLGGNFVALDSAYRQGALSQMINGLTSGNTYALSFYWAGAQQYGKVGATTDQLAVSLGASTQNTAVLSVTDGSVSGGGFTGWKSVTMSFTATGSSELLSFLASGTPTGGAQPPFALVGGISLIPGSGPPPVSDNTSTAALFGFSAILVGAAVRRRRLSCQQ